MTGSSPRRKIVALVLSGIFPGIGQFYNRQPLKGVAFAVVSGGLCWLAERALPADLLAENPLLLGQQGGLARNPSSAVLILLVVLLLVVWGWSLIDAWRAADR